MSATATKPNAQLKSHFVHLTPGKLMGLRQITDENNRFKVFALDQSNSFKKALRAVAEKAGTPKEPTYEDIRDAKLTMVEAGLRLGGTLTSTSAPGSTVCLPRGVGLIVRPGIKDAGIPSEYEPG